MDGSSWPAFFFRPNTGHRLSPHHPGGCKKGLTHKPLDFFFFFSPATSSPFWLLVANKEPSGASPPWSLQLLPLKHPKMDYQELVTVTAGRQPTVLQGMDGWMGWDGEKKNKIRKKKKLEMMIKSKAMALTNKTLSPQATAISYCFRPSTPPPLPLFFFGRKKKRWRRDKNKASKGEKKNKKRSSSFLTPQLDSFRLLLLLLSSLLFSQI